MKYLNINDSNFAAEFSALLDNKRESSVDVNDVVSSIITDIVKRGDEALFEYTKKFDKHEINPNNIKVDKNIINGLSQKVDEKLVEALEYAYDRIISYHEMQVPSDYQYVDSEGVMLGYRWNAVDSCGIYVPGGLAAYPSSLLMNAAPARVCGVERIAMVVPCPGGYINPAIMAAAKVANIDEIYIIGGAQAIAALAYGTELVKPVDLIVGPGNAYVAAAKKQVYGKVGIDMIAGPSEVLIIADNKQNPNWIASDMLAQAEHDEVAQSILITDDIEFAKKVENEVYIELKMLDREKIARASIEDYGTIIIVNDIANSYELANQIASEHLEIATSNPEEHLSKVKHAGAIFLGSYTPEAIGDYVAGPNHVLPTSRSAKFASGLNVLNFLKKSTIMKCDYDSLSKLGRKAETIAIEEGLSAHAMSITKRLDG